MNQFTFNFNSLHEFSTPTVGVYKNFIGSVICGEYNTSVMTQTGELQIGEHVYKFKQGYVLIKPLGDQYKQQYKDTKLKNIRQWLISNKTFVKNFLKTQCKDLDTELKQSLNIDNFNDLMTISIEGSSEVKGTYFHPSIVLDVLTWICPQFKDEIYNIFEDNIVQQNIQRQNIVINLQGDLPDNDSIRITKRNLNQHLPEHQDEQQDDQSTNISVETQYQQLKQKLEDLEETIITKKQEIKEKRDLLMEVIDVRKTVKTKQQIQVLKTTIQQLETEIDQNESEYKDKSKEFQEMSKFEKQGIKYKYLYQTNLQQKMSDQTINNKQIKYLQKAIKTHNDKYDYSKTVYIGSHQKIIITCPLHGDFEQEASSHLTGCGCKKCSFEQMGLNSRKQSDEFIQQAQQIHNNKYEYLKTEYTTKKSKIIITCPLHGDFTQLASNHLSGTGCKECFKNTVSLRKRKSQTYYIEKSNQIHNNYYDYTNTIFTTVSSKVTIICPKHGEFEQITNNHLKGSGCPNCINKTEGILYKFLSDKYNVEQQKTFDWLIYKSKQRVDFYIEELNLVIECQGVQHFKNVEYFKNRLEDQQQMDLNKEQLLKQNGISIIYIDQMDVWNNKNNWEQLLLQSIEFIANSDKYIWKKLCIGSVYQ